MKPRLLIAVAIIVGSASLAAAQSIPRMADDSSQMNYGPIAGRVAAPVDSIPAAPSSRFGDDSGQASYARDGASAALAAAPAPVNPTGCSRLGDDSGQMCYGR
jgi:hypothetical protein